MWVSDVFIRSEQKGWRFKGNFLRWDLPPLRSADNGDLDRKERDKEKIPSPVDEVLTAWVADCIIVHIPIQRGANGDSISEKERVNQGIHHPGAPSDDVLGHDLQRGVGHPVTRHEQVDGALRQR